MQQFDWIPFPQAATIALPPEPEWKYRLGHLHVHVPPGEEPNRFHRWMQNVFLGLNWQRIKKSQR